MTELPQHQATDALEAALEATKEQDFDQAKHQAEAATALLKAASATDKQL